LQAAQVNFHKLINVVTLDRLQALENGRRGL